MPVPITGLYVALTIILSSVLSGRVGIMRAKTKIAILDGGNTDLAVRMRQHGNLMETAALALLIFGIIEMNGAGPYLLHGLGITYLVGRILHPIGLNATSVTSPLRGFGTGLTLLTMMIASVYAIWQFISSNS